MSKLTKISNYSSLKSSIKFVIQKAERVIREAKLEAYWQTGKLIASHIKAKGGRAGYGHNIIHRLASDLETNKSHLYRCLEFYRAYPIVVTLRQLGWSHYIALLSINNPQKRKRVTALAVENKWSVRRLRREIEKLRSIRQVLKRKKLTPRLGKPGVYAVKEWKGRPAYDLGFSCFKTIRKKRKRKPIPSQLFTYYATVERVVDGDTLWAKIDFGFGFGTRQKLRLRGIDAPELKTRKGREAKAFLSDLLRPGETILLKTSQSDKYDRYLADLFVGDLFVNQLLLDEGHAHLA